MHPSVATKTTKKEISALCTEIMPSLTWIAKLDEDSPAWNIDGSSGEKPPSGRFWISEWEHVTGHQKGLCSFTNPPCKNPATDGGHLWLSYPIITPKGQCFVAPICRGCNYEKNDKRKQDGGSKLRKGTLLILAPYTEAMRTTERRRGTKGATDRPQRRTCCACLKDISTQSEDHTHCYQCFKRKCESCETPIKYDAPSSWIRCPKCQEKCSPKCQAKWRRT